MPNLIPALIIVSIWSGAFVLAFVPFVFLMDASNGARLLALGVVPILFLVLFPTIAGLLSFFGQKGIKRGKFPRELLHPVYLRRRIYGAAWTQVYYFKPVYAVILAIPVLKMFVFRLFGYGGSTNFTVYPDTWIRDLPILEIGEGAYLSNRATIGTNICLMDGTILVSKIAIKKKGMVGHLAMLAPGVKIEESGEVGVGCAIGINARIGRGASIKPSCTINHGAIIGNEVDVGTMSFVGLRAEIADGISIPAGSNIPAGAVLKTQEDVEKYYSSETEMLRNHRETVFSEVRKFLEDE